MARARRHTSRLISSLRRFITRAQYARKSAANTGDCRLGVSGRRRPARLAQCSLLKTAQMGQGWQSDHAWLHWAFNQAGESCCRSDIRKQRTGAHVLWAHNSTFCLCCRGSVGPGLWLTWIYVGALRFDSSGQAQPVARDLCQGDAACGYARHDLCKRLQKLVQVAQALRH